MRNPQPLAALPHDVEARGSDGTSALALGRWLERGARASALIPAFSCASPPGEAWVAPNIDWPDSAGSSLNGHFALAFSVAPASSVARGARGLLAVTCAARC